MSHKNVTIKKSAYVVVEEDEQENEEVNLETPAQALCREHIAEILAICQSTPNSLLQGIEREETNFVLTLCLPGKDCLL